LTGIAHRNEAATSRKEAGPHAWHGQVLLVCERCIAVPVKQRQCCCYVPSATYHASMHSSWYLHSTQHSNGERPATSAVDEGSMFHACESVHAVPLQSTGGRIQGSKASGNAIGSIQPTSCWHKLAQIGVALRHLRWFTSSWR
jgi:hypothetical protein